MTQTIDEDTYDEEVRTQARHLQEALEDEERIEEPIEMVIDVLDAHPWFSGDGLTGADYGAIISDFDTFNGNIITNRDPETLLNSDDFDVTLRRMAFGTFETDVLLAHSNEDFNDLSHE